MSRIRVSANDGTIQTFPAGTSNASMRMGMDAYHNPDVWGPMGPQVRQALGQLTEGMSDFVDGLRVGALKAGGPETMNAIANVSGTRPNTTPLYAPEPSHLSHPYRIGRMFGAGAGNSLHAAVGIAGSDDVWDGVDAVGEIAMPVFEAAGHAADAVGRAGQKIVNGLIPYVPRPSGQPRQRR